MVVMREEKERKARDVIGTSRIPFSALRIVWEEGKQAYRQVRLVRGNVDVAGKVREEGSGFYV